jgi:hypothetical protein
VSAELEILDRLLARLEALQVSLNDDLNLLETMPGTLAEFEAMAPHRKSASKAVLKSFEQIEDQLARAFRVVPKLVGEDTSRWFARDYADYMERYLVLDDAAAWTKLVKLRNELVHDYPLDPNIQFERFRQAVQALPFLKATNERLTRFVAVELPRHL